MADPLLLIVGALALATIQTIGLALIWLCGENHREARSWWYALTAWVLWLGPYIASARRRDRDHLARQGERAPAPELSEKWLRITDERRNDDA